MSSVWWVCAVAAAASLGAWMASLVTHDTSWVDRSWSVLPVIYVIIVAANQHFAVARLDAMAALVTLWGVRLTYNFARKGGYRGVEDYRWAVLRASMSPRRFQLFNVVFIVLYQNALLVLIALPALSVQEHAQRPWGIADLLLTILFLVALAGETLADQQQWNFHYEKRQRLARGETAEPGFLRTGLFAYARHPNYFFEIVQWWIVFAFAVVGARTLLQWTAIGPVLLSALFVGSTRFTESISAAKYPEYADYQREVSAIIPWRRRGPRVRERFAPDST